MSRFTLTILIALAGAVMAFVLVYMYFARDLDETHDFGVVVGIPSVEHVFEVPNFTHKVLAIKNTSTSCGCTVVGELPEEVAPFSTLRVPISMNITQKQGLATSKVTVQFSGGRVANFNLIATVYPALPERIDFGRFKRGDTVVKRYGASTDMEGLPGECMPVVGVRLAQMRIEASPIIEVAITPEFAESKEFTIDLPVTCANDNGARVTIEGYVEDSVEARTSQVSLGYTKQSEPTASQRVEFYSPYDKEFVWQKDLTRLPDFVSISQPDPTSSFLEFSLSPPLQPGLINERIEVHFSVAGEDTVTVPITLHAYVTSPELDRKDLAAIE